MAAPASHALRPPHPCSEALLLPPAAAPRTRPTGILTAVAIFIHNFPEGLATFVGALADTKIGVGLGAWAMRLRERPAVELPALPLWLLPCLRRGCHAAAASAVTAAPANVVP